MIERELTDYLLISACNASLVASKKIMDIFNSNEIVDVKIKSDNTIITEADFVSHNAIKSYLSQTRIPLLSEEGRNMLYEERYRWDLYWLTDPLDGTREFVKHSDEFVVCIALMIDNKPYFGVIAAPAKGKLYFSDPDRGAFCIDDTSKIGDKELSITSLFSAARKLSPVFDNNFDKIRLLSTRSHMNDQTQDIIDQQKSLYKTVEVTPCGSSLKYCLLAEGMADGYIRMGQMLDWDLAAGHAIINAIGGDIRHLDGSSIQYNKQELTIDPFAVNFKKVLLSNN